MSRICQICEKGSKRAANRSHANNKTLRRQHANIQTVAGIKVCTRCMKTVSRMAA